MWNVLSRAGCGLAGCLFLAGISSVPAVAQDVGPPAGDGELPLALRVTTEGTSEDPVVSYRHPLRLTLSNTSSEVLVLNDPNHAGSFPVRIAFRNRRTGESFTVARADADWTESRTLQLELFGEDSPRLLLPGEDVTFDVQLSEFDAFGRSPLPVPNSPDKFDVAVEYVSRPPPDVPDRAVWKGVVRAPSLIARLADYKLVRPHEYLEAGFEDFALEMLATRPVFINQHGSYLRTPLIVAAGRGLPRAVAWLLEHGAEVNAVDQHGRTALHVVSQPEIAAILLAARPDLAKRIGDGWQRTALQQVAARLEDEREASRHDDLRRIARLLIDAGAEYDIGTAVRLNDLERVRALPAGEKRQLEFAQGEENFLRLAAKLGRREICEFLIGNFVVDLNDFERGYGYPILMEALDHPDIVGHFVKHGADLKTRITWKGARSGGPWIVGDDATLLHHAAERGAPESIRFLLDGGINPFSVTTPIFPGEGAFDQTALDVAAVLGNAENVQAIIDHPSFQQSDAGVRQAFLNKALIAAAAPHDMRGRKRNFATLTVLLSHGADPNYRVNGRTALEIAAVDSREATIDVLRLLRGHGAKLDLYSAVLLRDQFAVSSILAEDPGAARRSTAHGRLPLHAAVAGNQHEILSNLLLQSDVNARENDAWNGLPDKTALHSAAEANNLAAAKLLLDFGADANATDFAGETPLHAAAERGHFAFMRLMLQRGANVDLKNARGEVVDDIVRRRSFRNAEEFGEMLREFRQSRVE